MKECLKQELREHQVDLEVTIARFMGNEPLFLKFLKKFPQDPNFMLLKENIEKKDVEEAFKNAHTLKGVTANLGLNSLHSILDPMVEILRANSVEGIEEMLERLTNQYEVLCKIIQDIDE